MVMTVLALLGVIALPVHLGIFLTYYGKIIRQGAHIKSLETVIRLQAQRLTELDPRHPDSEELYRVGI